MYKRNPIEIALSFPIANIIVVLILVVYAVHGQFSFFHQNDAFFWRGVNLINSEGGSNSFGTRAVMYGTALLTLLLTISCIRVGRVLSFLKNNGYLVAIVALATLSALWSQDPSRTLQRDVYFILNLCFAFYLTQRFSTIQVMRLLVAAGAIAIAASALLVLVVPKYGIFHDFQDGSAGLQGIYNHKNELGAMTIFLLTPALFLPMNRLLRFAYVSFSLLLIGLSQSRGAWIVCVAVLVFVAVLKLAQLFERRQRLAVQAVALAVSICCAAVVLASLPEILRLMHKDASWTGRIPIWSVLGESIAKRTLLGYGYNAFWLGPIGESGRVALAVRWTGIGYAENGIIELCLQLGGIGVLLFVLAYLQALYRLPRLMRWKSKSPELLWCACVLFLLAASNVAAGNIASYDSLDFLYFLVTLIAIGKYTRHIGQLPCGAYRSPSTPIVATLETCPI